MTFPDWQVALATALVVATFFYVLSVAQRYRVVAAAPLLTEVEPMTPGMAGFEGRLKLRLDTIEQRQKDDQVKLARTEHDVNNIRMALSALPSKDTVHRLEVQLTKVEGSVEAIQNVGISQQRSLDRIINHLMKDDT